MLLRLFAVSLVFLALLLTSMACIPLWVALSKRIGKKASYMAGMSLLALAMLIIFFLGQNQILFVYILAVIAGLGLSTFYVLPWSMIPDTIEYNELQCGSYAFMDADYGRILDRQGKRIDQGEWENALFILTSVMSHAKADKAICDAGLKAQSVDSGLPFVYARDDVKYVKCSDEHGVIEDTTGVLKINEKLRLAPGHCDPTCNVHDWYVGVRGGVVETVWPVSARGKAY